MGASAVFGRSRIVVATAFAGAVLFVMAGQPVQAAELPSVTASVSGQAISLSSATVSGAIDDTFTIVNADTSHTLTVYDATAVVEIQSGYDCFSGCVVNFSGSGSSNTTTFTIKKFGTLTLQGNGLTDAVLVIGSAPAGGGSDPALVYPTAYLNPNKGSCTGTLQFTKKIGQNGTITTPDATACTRSDYKLDGWARTDSATTAEFGPGKVVPIGDESFTLYAVWAPVEKFIEVTYDANVGAPQTCRDAQGVDIAEVTTWTPRGVEVTENKRKTTRVESTGSEPASTAICKPPWGVLGGWSTSPLDAVPAFAGATRKGTVVGLRQSFADAWATSVPPTKVTLYAMWTLPTVRLMESALGGAQQAEVPWNSRLTMGPNDAVYSGFSCDKQSVVALTPKGDQLTFGSGNYFVATDLLGQPAPYTTLILGALGSSLQIRGPGLVGMGTTALPIDIPNGTWVTVDTAEDGTTRSRMIGAYSGANVYDQMIAFQWPILGCPSNTPAIPGEFGLLSAFTNNSSAPLNWQIAQVVLGPKR